MGAWWVFLGLGLRESAGVVQPCQGYPDRYSYAAGEEQRVEYVGGSVAIASSPSENGRDISRTSMKPPRARVGLATLSILA